MHYNFPRIERIEDVLPHIKDVMEFIVADRGDHTIINYVVSTPDAFPPIADPENSEFNLTAKIRRECRGIIFDKNGDIIRRPYHKFFNVNQTEDTQLHQINFDFPHTILEKLDGSMIVPYTVNGRMIAGTKMGDTDIATFAQEFIEARPNYVAAITQALAASKSLIFEFCSRKQQIVIDYPEDRLVLTAIRDLYTGEYTHYSNLVTFAAGYGLDVVKIISSGEKLPADTIEWVRAQIGLEGIVFRFDDGQMLKVKAEDYLRVHSARDKISDERYVMQMIMANQFDDLIANVLESDRKELDRYEAAFWKNLTDYVSIVCCSMELNFVAYDSRKEYALWNTDSPLVKQATFHYWDVGTANFLDVRDYIIKRAIMPSFSTKAKFADMKNVVLPHVRYYR